MNKLSPICGWVTTDPNNWTAFYRARRTLFATVRELVKAGTSLEYLEEEFEGTVNALRQLLDLTP